MSGTLNHAADCPTHDGGRCRCPKGRKGRKRLEGTVALTMTWDQARMLGIARCACGHPENNHFEWDRRPCAHCSCKGLDERIVLPRAELEAG